MPDRPSRYFTLTPDQLAGYQLEKEVSPADKKDKKRVDQALPVEVRASLVALETAMDERFTEFGKNAPGIETPVLPPEFTESHLEVVREFFGNTNLEATALPNFDRLTDEYFAVMFPDDQRQRDIDKGLISHKPDWWNNTADEGFSISEDESQRTGKPRSTWGELYVKSMHSEAVEMQGSLFFSETIQKPNYINGSQQYGTKEGRDDSHDRLLPIIKEIFGDSANRFNLTWDQINQELIPQLKGKLAEALRARGLTALKNFDIIITPALVSNLQTTLKHPADSETDTYDWTSTPLMTQEGQDSGFRLFVGNSGNGGAGCVDGAHRDGSWLGRGFRLSVVLKNT